MLDSKNNKKALPKVLEFMYWLLSVRDRVMVIQQKLLVIWFNFLCERDIFSFIPRKGGLSIPSLMSVLPRRQSIIRLALNPLEFILVGYWSRSHGRDSTWERYTGMYGTKNWPSVIRYSICYQIPCPDQSISSLLLSPAIQSIYLVDCVRLLLKESGLHARPASALARSEIKFVASFCDDRENTFRNIIGGISLTSRFEKNRKKLLLNNWMRSVELKLELSWPSHTGCFSWMTRVVEWCMTSIYLNLWTCSR